MKPFFSFIDINIGRYFVKFNVKWKSMALYVRANEKLKF